MPEFEICLLELGRSARVFRNSGFGGLLSNPVVFPLSLRLSVKGSLVRRIYGEFCRFIFDSRF